MDFFMTGELGIEDSDHAIDLIKDVEAKIKVLEVHDYGSTIKDIGVIPIIMSLSPELEEQGFFRERKLVKRKCGEADYRLKIDYDKFVNSSDEVRTLLIVKNVIASIRDIGRKVKDFDAERFEKDILDLFQINVEQLEEL